MHSSGEWIEGEPLRTGGRRGEMAMANKTSFDETKALELYHAHKSDTEIAKGVGTLTMTIRSWRNRKGLKNISPGASINTHYVGAGGGVNYRTALSPDQAKDMNRFLGTLIWACDKAKEAGVKPNLYLFMRAWIGLPISVEGKRQQRRRQQGEYERRNGKDQVLGK